LRRGSGQAAQTECAVHRCYSIGDPRPLLIRKRVAYVAVGRIALLSKDAGLTTEHVVESECVEATTNVGSRGLVGTSLSGAKHGVEVVVR